MATPSLETKTRNFALKLRKEKKFPAVVVGAEFSYFKKVEMSGLFPAIKLVKSLRTKLLTIGELYTKANGNIIGACAEVNAANKVLIERPYAKLNQIGFSKPLRPKTMQVIPICKNCNQTFK